MSRPSPLTSTDAGPKGSSAVPWKYDQRIASDPNNCAKVIEVLLDQLDSAQWPNKDTFGIHMAMEEAIMNAICHGNKRDIEKEVHVVIELREDSFYACVTDQGNGFDPSDLPDPAADENIDKTTGRGVKLIHHFVDEVIYNEVGNSVELKKNKTAATAEWSLATSLVSSKLAISETKIG